MCCAMVHTATRHYSECMSDEDNELRDVIVGKHMAKSIGDKSENSIIINNNNNNARKRPDLILVKLGGSAATHKGEFESANLEVIRETAKQIHAGRRLKDKDKERGIDLVLVHGAGSFGHFQAKQFGLRGGGREDWRRGVSVTRERFIHSFPLTKTYTYYIYITKTHT